MSDSIDLRVFWFFRIATLVITAALFWWADWSWTVLVAFVMGQVHWGACNDIENAQRKAGTQ